MPVFSDPLLILAVLCFTLAISEWLVRRTFLKKIGTALLVIIVTAVVANFGIIPSFDPGSPTYDSIFEYVAPIAIFYLLLDVNLKNLRAAGGPMIFMFLVGSFATMIGVLSSATITGLQSSLGADFASVSGMFTGTYTGGSINFNAIALEFSVNENGPLFATSVAVDNVVTALWMLCTLSLPKILQNKFPRVNKSITNDAATSNHSESEKVNILDMAILILLGISVLTFSDYTAEFFSTLGFRVPSILILTTISLILAQFKQVARLKGFRFMGLLGVYLFLAVIGAFCDFSVFVDNWSLAVILFLFVFLAVLFHGLFVFAFGYFFKQDWTIVSIASQANVGGSTSAMALAKSLGRNDLVLPAILVGTLGNGIGTYLGFLVVSLLA